MYMEEAKKTNAAHGPKFCSMKIAQDVRDFIASGGAKGRNEVAKLDKVD
jgi:hypothetical protein